MDLSLYITKYSTISNKMIYTLFNSLCNRVNIYLDELVEEIEDMADDFDDEYDEESNTFVEGKRNNRNMLQKHD